MYRSAASDDFSFYEHPAPTLSWHRRQHAGHNSYSSIEWPTESVFPAHQEVAISPGQMADDHFLQATRSRGDLKKAVDFFLSHGSYSANDRLTTISETTWQAARRLIDLLPFNVSLPKAAPDGEAGLMLYWAQHENDVVVTVDQNLLHLVVRAGTPQSEYHEDIVFEGDAIPRVILGAIQG